MLHAMSPSGAAAGDTVDTLRASGKAQAHELAAAVAVCVDRRDTDHPVFRGCYDWHSAVHGVWALAAHARLTGDDRHRAQVQALLTAEGIAAERAYLKAHPEFEMPYGRAWFLRLAVDYKRAFGDDRLDAMANEVADSLVAHYTKSPPDPLATAYDNASWALINLRLHGVFAGRADVVRFVDEAVRARFLGEAACPLVAAEVETREFMAICTNRAWLVGQVLPGDRFRPWLNTFLPASLPISPIMAPATVHQAGLNFSRAWGLWGLYVRTGEERFLEAYRRHYDEAYGRRDIWDGDYDKYRHWIPQFGMMALVQLHDEAPPVAP
jgi:hypothetical protein